MITWVVSYLSAEGRVRSERVRARGYKITESGAIIFDSTIAYKDWFKVVPE